MFSLKLYNNKKQQRIIKNLKRLLKKDWQNYKKKKLQK